MDFSTTRRWWKLVSLAVVMLLVLAACSGGSDDAGTDAVERSFDSPVAEPPLGADEQLARDGGFEEAADAPSEDLAAPEGAGTGESVVAQIRQATRQIIFTADLTVAVTDVATSGSQAIDLIEDLGGFLFGQQSVGLPEPQSILVFKVDPDRFQEALERLGAIGEVRNQNVSADDVTDRIVDLESRIATAETSVDRLRELLRDADSVEAIAALEGQLLARETELESMRGQLRTLQDRVALATITLTLTEALSRPQLDLAITAYPGHGDAGESCPGDGSVVVDEGDPVTVCFEITNVGDMPLTDFEIRDTVLEVETGDLLVVFGDPEGTLEPGQFLIMAAEIAPERTIRTETRVTAAPVNADGEVLENRRVSSTNAVFVQAIDPGGLPGFGDGLSTSVELVRQLGGLLVLAAGIVIPLLWIPLLVWLFLRWRRTREDDADIPADPDSPAPAPS